MWAKYSLCLILSKFFDTSIPKKKDNFSLLDKSGLLFGAEEQQL